MQPVPNLSFDPPQILADGCPQLSVAVAAASAGGRLIHDYFHGDHPLVGTGKDAAFNLVSRADVESEQAIAAIIRSSFPDHAILGEEQLTADITAEDLWIVDPLDGTNNFLHRIPHFAVSIAYYHRGQPRCGVVVNPVRGDWYWAAQGQGAFHNNRPMRVSPAGSLSETMVGCGFYYDRGAMMEATLAAIHAFFKQQIHGIRRFGTAALDICQVADGQFGAFFEYQLAAWDFAAARLILEEAGGRVTTGWGEPLPLATTSLLASNTTLHPAALSIVREYHPHGD